MPLTSRLELKTGGNFCFSCFFFFFFGKKMCGIQLQDEIKSDQLIMATSNTYQFLKFKVGIERNPIKCFHLRSTIFSWQFKFFFFFPVRSWSRLTIKLILSALPKQVTAQILESNFSTIRLLLLSPLLNQLVGVRCAGASQE